MLRAGQTILVAGGTGKLGLPIVKSLLEKDCHVLVPTRSEEDARAESDLAMHENLKFIQADLAKSDGVFALIQTLEDQELLVDKFVYSARTLETLAVGDDGITSRVSFMAELNLQVVAPYQLATKLAHSPHHNLDSIVLIGSQYGVVAPNPALYGGSLNQSPIQYGVSKAAVHHLTKELAVRLAPRVRVNAVAFGGFEGRTDEEFKLRYSNMLPIGRMLADEESIGPVLFLLSQMASSVNGHVLIADGGWSIW